MKQGLNQVITEQLLSCIFHQHLFVAPWQVGKDDTNKESSVGTVIDNRPVQPNPNGVLNTNNMGNHFAPATNTDGSHIITMNNNEMTQPGNGPSLV